RQLAQHPTPQLSFNYLGVIEQATGEHTREGSQFFHATPMAPEESGPPFSLKGRRPHVLDLLGRVQNGQLHLTWIYSQRLHARSTIEHIAHHYAETLRRLIDHCRNVETHHYTPSDFPTAGLNQARLDK